MKVPENIKKAIKEVAEYSNNVKFSERIVIEWLETMKLTEDTCTDILRNMENAFIDYCKMSNNPDEFFEVIENLRY